MKTESEKQQLLKDATEGAEIVATDMYQKAGPEFSILIFKHALLLVCAFAAGRGNVHTRPIVTELKANLDNAVNDFLKALSELTKEQRQEKRE